MTDPILTARVDALTQSLELVQRSVQLIDQMLDREEAGGAAYGGINYSGLRKNLADLMKVSVRQCIDELDKVRELQGGNGHAGRPAAAWRQYAEAQDRSQELFSGCLEFIGGCAFRRELGRAQSDREDRQIGEVADELMIEAAYAALNETDPFLTVPALEDALTESRVRTIRLRFPDWTLWNLPLMAYDFGHVAISQFKGPDIGGRHGHPLTTLLTETTKEVIAADASLQHRLAGADEERRERMQRRAKKAVWHRLRVLLADAFATRWMGPAYACAAIHLRFDPSAAYSGSPSYDERARMVIGTLREMTDGQEHRDMVESLSEQWQAAVEQADPPDPAFTPRDDVGMFQDAVRDTMQDLPSAALYTRPFWDRAQTTYELWASAHRDHLLLDESAAPGERLRDVLNAAWLCRVERADEPKLIEAVSRAALRQCAGIATAAREKRDSAERGGFGGRLKGGE